MSIWEAIEKLSELVDDSDPDVGFSWILHSVLRHTRSSAALPFYGPLTPAYGSCACAS